jgi:hypothetical protein
MDHTKTISGNYPEHSTFNLTDTVYAAPDDNGGYVLKQTVFDNAGFKR